VEGGEEPRINRQNGRDDLSNLFSEFDFFHKLAFRMRKIKSITIFVILCTFLSCSSDKYDLPVPNTLVPLRIGSNWIYRRTCFGCLNGQTESEYSIVIDYSKAIDNETWYHLKFPGQWNSGEEYYWKTNESGFWEKIVSPSAATRTYFYPIYSGSNWYESVTPLGGDTMCQFHDEYRLNQINCLVNNVNYDSYQYAFDTSYFSGNCTGGFILLYNQVRYISKGVGIVKKVGYDISNVYHLSLAPDSAIIWKDELIQFNY